MHIVHVISGLKVGGAEHMLRRVALSLRGADDPIGSTVVSLGEVGEMGELLRRDGFEVIALGMTGVAGLPRVWLSLWRLLRQRRPDVVQTWMVHADFVGGLAAKMAGVPNIVWGIRTTDFTMESRSTRAVRWICARLSGWVPDHIVCAADSSRRAHEADGYDPSKMLVIPNGFDLLTLRLQSGRGAALRQTLGLAAGEVIIGCVGRYHAAKDHANFVRAAALVAARHPDCRFLMVGRDISRDNAELMAELNNSGCASRFLLVGERPDVAACLDAMDVFVLSSRSEGFPNVLGEAMAMGVACASTTVGDAAVLLGDCGRLVPPHNPQALADAVLDLLQIPLQARRALGQAAQERIARLFSLESTVARFRHLYAGSRPPNSNPSDSKRCAD